ncbi:hypothetical protein F1880_006070 [Penicillium rolfsii]|nr:hypothetical protein F1880_006070 [Penicillium rolfsii]
MIGHHAFLAGKAPLYQTGLLLISRNKWGDERAAANHDSARPQSEYDELANLTDFKVRKCQVPCPHRSYANEWTESQVSILDVMSHGKDMMTELCRERRCETCSVLLLFFRLLFQGLARGLWPDE